MNKSGSITLNSIEDILRKRKEPYFFELANAVTKFIKTDYKTNLLQDFVCREAELSQQYKMLTNTQKIAREIAEIQIKQMKSITQDLELLNCINEQKVNALENTVKADVNPVAVEIEDILNSYITKIQEYSYLNAIHDLYSIQSKTLLKEKTYRDVDSSHPEMKKILKKIDENKRIEVMEHSKKNNLVLSCVCSYPSYFNVRKNCEKSIVSLSPQGKDFAKYYRNKAKKFSRLEVGDIQYNTMLSLIESINLPPIKNNTCKLNTVYMTGDQERNIQTHVGRLTRRLTVVSNSRYPQVEQAFIKNYQERDNNNDGCKVIRTSNPSIYETFGEKW